MMNFGSLKNAKAIAKEKHQEKKANVEEIISEGKKLFESFLKTTNLNDLKKSADFFFKALAVKRTLVEPYFYISSIFFMYEKKENAIRYLKFAEEVDPTYPNLVNLRQLIFKN